MHGCTKKGEIVLYSALSLISCGVSLFSFVGGSGAQPEHVLPDLRLLSYDRYHLADAEYEQWIARTFHFHFESICDGTVAGDRASTEKT